MASVSKLIPGKWYVSKRFRITRRTDDPNTKLEQNQGLHETIAGGPFDSKKEAEDFRGSLPNPDEYEAWPYQP